LDYEAGQDRTASVKFSDDPHPDFLCRLSTFCAEKTFCATPLCGYKVCTVYLVLTSVALPFSAKSKEFALVAEVGYVVSKSGAKALFWAARGGCGLSCLKTMVYVSSDGRRSEGSVVARPLK
jgi:hypothetical protein